MTTPDERKTLKVSPVIHARIMELAGQINGSAEEALAHLLGESSIRLPVSPVQQARWTSVARSLGMPLTDFVTARVEATLTPSVSPETVNQIFYRVDMILDHLGLRTASKSTRRHSVPKPSTD